MVAPAWGSFQRPNQQIQKAEQQEMSQEIPGEVNDQEKPEAAKPQWGNFPSPTTYQGEPDPTAEEGTFGWLARNIASNISRVGEQVAGRYGNIEKFGKETLSKLPQSAGVIGWAISKLVGPEKWERLVKGEPGREQLLPTSEQLKSASITATKGYTEPKTSGENRFQEYTEDFGAMLGSPRPSNLIKAAPTERAKQFAYNKFLIPSAANVTKDIVQGLGFGEDKANMAKMAVWLPLSLASNVNAPQYASALMNEGRQGLPSTLQANIPRFTQRLDNVERSLLSADPRTALARQTLSGLRNDIASGQTNAQSLMTMYDGVNAAKRNRGLFELGKGDQNFARKSIDKVRDAVKQEILDIGAPYPQALEKWQDGIRAWATIHKSNAITNWIQDVAKGPYAKILSGPAAALFGIGSYGASKAPIVGLTGAAAIPASYKTGQTLYRIWNDPNLAEYYWKSIGAAQNESLSAFISNYNKLNKKLEKLESVQPKSNAKKQ